MINPRQIFTDPQQGSTARSAQIARRPPSQRIRARYGFVVCIGLSLLLHALLILVPATPRIENPAASKAQQDSLTVHLSRPVPPAPPAATPPPAPRPKPKAASRRPAAVASSKPAPPLPAVPQIPAAPAAPEPAAEPAQALDMTAMLNAKRAQRRAAEALADPAPAAGAHEPAASNDIALANIKRSLQTPPGGSSGTGGVFQIVSKGTRSAQFVFRGWLAGSRNNWRQTIDVDAGLNGDVDRAIVRRMIELIRGHYAGDFSWESHRLGRVIVLSARPHDNADLEAFLMREFFGV